MFSRVKLRQSRPVMFCRAVSCQVQLSRVVLCLGSQVMLGHAMSSQVRSRQVEAVMSSHAQSSRVVSSQVKAVRSGQVRSSHVKFRQVKAVMLCCVRLSRVMSRWVWFCQGSSYCGEAGQFF